MDEARLAAIRARRAAATPGPWHGRIHGGFYAEVYAADPGDPLLTFHGNGRADPQIRANQAFVACAWADVGALLAEIDRLHAVRGEAAHA